MVTILAMIFTAGLILIAMVGMAFFISSIQEKEKRASIYGGIQLFGMIFLVIAFLYLYSIGIFNSGIGVFILTFLVALGIIVAILFCRKTSPNEKALKGAKGYISGEVTRFDERDHVFARNRSLPVNSEQYAAYYRKHPELKNIDSKRRSKGGPIGRPGAIDSSGGDANVAAILACLSLPNYLSTPDKYSPEPHMALKEKLAQKKVIMSPEEATIRLKGYAKALGASLVGVTKINPLWIYSHRGEIFNNN